MENKNNQEKEISVKFELPEVANNVLAPTTESIGKLLNDIFNSATIGIHYWSKKKIYIKEKNYQKFIEQTNKELNKIKPENYVEPDINIVGEIANATNLYLEKEHYQKMFSKLLAASVNSDKKSKIHPSFPSIIKQLSQLDAELLIKFHLANKTKLKICQLRKINNINSLFYNYRYYYINYKNDTYSEFEKTESINNLERLNLVKVDFDHHLTKRYNTKAFEKCKSVIDIRKNLEEYENIEFVHGIIYLTQLGMVFLETCL